MGRHLVRSLFDMLVTIFGLMVLSFVILKLLPGGPFDDESSIHPLVRERLDQAWSLSKPPIQQFFSYMQSVLTGQFGESLAEPGRTVGEILWQGLSASIALDLLALLVVGIFGGLFAATVVLAKSAWISTSAELLMTAFVSLPSLFLGPFLIYCFSYHWDILPAAKLMGPSSYILPVIALAIRPSAYLARILSRNWKEQSQADYMKLALAKGLSFHQAVFGHALKNSLIPAVSYMGPVIVHLISGSFLVEILFVIPGLGTVFVHSLANRDYPVILGITLFLGIIVVCVSFAIDLINQKLDPRWKK